MRLDRRLTQQLQQADAVDYAGRAGDAYDQSGRRHSGFPYDGRYLPSRDFNRHCVQSEAAHLSTRQSRGGCCTSESGRSSDGPGRLLSGESGGSQALARWKLWVSLELL